MTFFRELGRKYVGDITVYGMGAETVTCTNHQQIPKSRSTYVILPLYKKKVALFWDGASAYISGPRLAS